MSVDATHSHVQVELPDSEKQIRLIIGRAKNKSSRAVKRRLPGRVWAAGGDYDSIDSPKHQEHALNYILTKQRRGAWTWCYRQPLPTIDPPVKSTRSGDAAKRS